MRHKSDGRLSTPEVTAAGKRLTEKPGEDPDLNHLGLLPTGAKAFRQTPTPTRPAESPDTGRVRAYSFSLPCQTPILNSAGRNRYQRDRLEHPRRFVNLPSRRESPARPEAAPGTWRWAGVVGTGGGNGGPRPRGPETSGGSGCGGGSGRGAAYRTLHYARSNPTPCIQRSFSNSTAKIGGAR